MQTFYGRALVVFLLASLGACKENIESQLNLSDSVKRALDQLQLTDEQREIICSQNSLFVLVANGESMGHPAVFPRNGNLHSRQNQIDAWLGEQNANHSKFIESMRYAENDLKAQIATAGCPANSVGSATLAVVFDGPGSGDSRIEVTGFPSEGRPSTQSYAWNNGTLIAGGGSFELNLAKDVSGVLKAIRGTASSDKPYTQINNFFKAHGGVVRLGNGQAGHMLFFDTNGPNGKLSSNLWHPVWTTEGLYEVCGKQPDPKHPNLDFCRRMLTEYSALSGAGSGPASGAGSVSASGSGSGPASGSGTGPASGSGTGPASGSGSGPASGSGSGPASGSGTGPASGNQLASYGLETGDPRTSQFSEVASASMAQGYIILGEAGSYDGAAADNALTGVHSIKIPLAIPAVSVRQPSLIIFDSCTMADNVTSSLIANNRLGTNNSSGIALTGTNEQVVLTFFNQNPLYYFAINYRLLNGLQYRALPYVLAWSRGGTGVAGTLATSSVKAAADAIEKGLASRGLDRNRVIEHHIDPNPAERANLNPEYLRMGLGSQTLRMENVPSE